MIKRKTALNMAKKALTGEQQRYTARANSYLKEPWKYDDRSEEWKHHTKYQKYADAIKWIESMEIQQEMDFA